MRKNFLMSEYNSELVEGTKNMKFLKTYFSSLLIDIEDTIRITDDVINQTETARGTQLQNVLETDRNINLWQTKYKYSDITIYNFQSNLDKTEFPLQNIKIDDKNILIKYLFAQLKQNRTFEGVDISNILESNMDLTILNFIQNNILDRYVLTDVLLYVKYNKLDNNNLAYTPIKDQQIIYNNGVRLSDSEIISNNLINKNIELIKGDFTNVRYRQTESAKRCTFNQHYDLVYIKK